MEEIVVNKDVLKKAQFGDKDSLEILMRQNNGLVISIARRFLNRGHDMEDLIQIGGIGLLKAIRNFNLDYDVKFSTYAVPVIMGEIRRFLRDDGIIKVSRKTKELYMKIYFERERILKITGKEPSISELSENLDVSKEEIVLAIDSSNTPESLYKTIGNVEEAGQYMIDKIKNIEKGFDNVVVDRVVIKEIINNLNEKEKQIIFLRFFKEKTQKQIADSLNISQVQVSRSIKKIIDNMRIKFLTLI